ncbi:MAG: aerobic-type carbon monoxide dehydrogenase, large subunit CoxL/CutL-like protein [Enterovirga sp.]|nr:aerobic-type carbon monoxide dehydrogenase, large subunit CoxL/CutL-like protein [Enterovirga sp.]
MSLAQATSSQGASARIGDAAPRPDLMRLLRGRGRYVADISLPRMGHLAFLRSPHAHARIVEIDANAARRAPGVIAVIAGADLVPECAPLVGVSANRSGHKAPPQYPMAVDTVFWQGQPVVAVVAASRAEAEDALDLIAVEWNDLPPILDGAGALAGDASPMHEALRSNVAYEHRIETGDPGTAFAEAEHRIAQRFVFNRQTGVTLEPRGLIASFDPGSESLTVYHSHQSPFQMQEVFCRHLGLPENKVRVIAPDVGGGFGIKINVYAEEVAVAAISRMLRRPVKFCADRLESFVSDVHVRDHDFTAEIAFASDGRIHAMAVDDVSCIGPFGMHLRFNIAESMMLLTNMGAPYVFEHYRGHTRNVFVNKNLIGMFRGVGIPLSCVATELLVDQAAKRIGMDPVAFRRQNYRKPRDLPCVTPAGTKLSNMALETCLDRLTDLMGYDALRAEQARLRKDGIYRGIGISTYVEPTAYGPLYYGPTGASVTSQDGCSLRLEPSGAIRCVTSITDQGQGTLTAVAQIVAETLGVSMDSIDLISGDSATSTYGGGAWASRGVVCGGEAALKAARDLAANVLAIAAAITQASPSDLALANGSVVDRRSGTAVISLAEVARIGYFRQDTLPRDLDVQLMVTRSHVANHNTYYTTSGVQASYLEIDPETGFVRLLGHWAVSDCGRVINPGLVDEQIRGGIVQGIGAVLYEECVYDDAGNMTNASLADYLVPMACEMPDIQVARVETHESSTELGAKGVGEAGLIGAMGALWVAANDALEPLGATILEQPFTPERVLDAIAAGGQPTTSLKEYRS